MIRVSDGLGMLMDARIVSLSGDRVEAEIISERKVARPCPEIAVFQGHAKGHKVEMVVQKLVELGVDEIVVFTSGRSIPRWDRARVRQSQARWVTIAREAAKQSRRAWLPRVQGPVGAAEAAPMACGRELALLADPSAGLSLRAALPHEAPEHLAIIIGPEGGLTSGELDEFVAAGAVPFSLGGLILRTETASLVAASAVMYQVGRLG